MNAHITDSTGDPQARPKAGREQTGWTSPTVKAWEEMVRQDRAHAERDRFRVPETQAEFEALSVADRTRLYIEHQDVYNRMTGRE